MKKKIFIYFFCSYDKIVTITHLCSGIRFTTWYLNGKITTLGLRPWVVILPLRYLVVKLIPVISRFQSNSNVLYLINCGNKSKSFLSFISFIVVSQHRVQVSCTSSYTPEIPPDAAYPAQYKLLSSFTNSFTANYCTS